MQRELPARQGEKFTAHLVAFRALWGGRRGAGKFGSAVSWRHAMAQNSHPGRLLDHGSPPESVAGDRRQRGQAGLRR